MTCYFLKLVYVGEYHIEVLQLYIGIFYMH